MLKILTSKDHFILYKAKQLLIDEFKYDTYNRNLVKYAQQMFINNNTLCLDIKTDSTSKRVSLKSNITYYLEQYVFHQLTLCKPSHKVTSELPLKNGQIREYNPLTHNTYYTLPYTILNEVIK